MHITQESDYAVRIVYCLAKCGTRRDARGISEEMCVTLRFSLKILGKLVSSGIVESYKGNRGGYELARPASEITLKDVIDAPCVPSVVFSFPLFSGFPLTACKNRIIMLKCIIMAWYVSERKTVTIFLCKLLKIGGVPKPFCVIFCKA